MYNYIQQKYRAGNSSLTSIRHGGLEELTLFDLETCRLICKASRGPSLFGIHELQPMTVDFFHDAARPNPIYKEKCHSITPKSWLSTGYPR